MAAPIAPALPAIPSRSAPEADFDVKMFALFKWATDDFVSFMEAWRAYLETSSTIVDGALNGTTIGQTTPAAGAFTELLAASLGGAAVQSSPTDATANKLLKNAAHGLGGTVPLAPDDDCNNITVTGFSAFENATANRPPFFGNGIILHAARTSGIHTQFAISRATATLGRAAVRANNGAGWSDWAEVYTQGSILGTVSQSGGVPTGALIERGSNANGEYVRFADGTQICTNQAFQTSDTADTTWTYPASFLYPASPGRPAVSGAASALSSAPAFLSIGGISGSGTVANDVAVRAVNLNGDRVALAASLIAIGRWF